MSKFIKTRPEQSLEIYCPECDSPIYQCDSCGNYFDPDTEIYCNTKAINGEHVCVECKGDEE